MGVKTIGLLRFILLGLILVGLYGALRVSYAVIAGESACPDLGLPLCYIVLAGYAAMFLSVWFKLKPKTIYYFMLAWLLVFLPAMAGTLLDLAAGDVCPKNSWGWSLCYLSLGLAVAIIVVFILMLRSHKRMKKKITGYTVS